MSIQPRQTTSGINAQLVNQGRIQGQVTNGSTPIAGIQVQAYDTIQTLRLLGTATTDGSGNYTIRLLPTANVRLLFHANGTSYASEWNSDKASFDTADAIAVTAGSTVNGINAVLVQGGSVSGTVTDERTGLPLNGIRAELWTAANQFYQAVTTDASGIYTFTGAAAGSYRLFFNRFSRFYGSEWYNNKAGFAAGDTITVLTGQALSGRDAALTPVSRVQGRVTNLSAAGIPNVTVEVRDANNQTVGSDTTDSMGYYYVYGIPEGTYWVYFDGTAAGYAGEYYSDKLTFAAGDTIAVTPGVFGPVANAQLAAGGGITGRVTGPGGAGVQNIKVQIKDIYGNNVAQPTTDINGDYSSGGMAAGTYRIFFSNNGLDYVSEWYSDRYTLQTASDVTVLAGSVTSNVNAQLVSSGTISGTVTDGSAGVSGVKVVLFDIYLNNTGFSATTDASGNYTIKAIPAGTYKIAFNSPTGGAAPSLIREWYNDKSTPQAADTVTVTAGGTLSGTNAVLAAGGNISGRVTSQSTGLGIGEIGVNAYDATGVQVSGAATDASGNFTVKSLATGSYRLEFNPATYNSKYAGTYLREYFNNKAGLAAADALAVTAGQTLSGVNAILASGGATISGRVTNAAGMGLRNVTVRVELEGYELSNQYSASTAVDGAYTVRGIPAGTYSVLFTPSGTSGNYARELYNDVVPRGWVWTGTPVVLTDGAVVSGIDAVLEAGGWVKGRVTDGAGAGIANVQVRTHDALTNDRVDAGPKTDAAGYYAASARPGQYKIFFSASESAGGQYAAEFYNNKTTLPAADAVTVTADQTTPNIDAVLAAGTAGGTIAGHVRDVGGNPVAGAGIQVFTLDGSNAMLVNVSTDPSGAFSLAGFIPGNYKLLTHLFWLGLEEWYSDKTSYAAADTITVSAGQTTTTDVYLGDSGTLTLTAPNGGEVLNVGQNFAITWTSSGTLGNVKLDYSTNSGANWTAIIASTENDGSYSWTVPSAPSINCLVRVSETDGNPTDQSNAVFTIGTVVSPTITVVSPNGGESLTVGAAHNITWSSTGVVGNVKIEYSIDGGSHYSEVVASTANDGSFSWTVPGTPATTCLVRLSETDGSPWDVSNAVFTIAVVTPPPVNGLAIDFGAAGFWIWENYIWTQVSGVNPESLAAADMDGDGADELVIDFGTVGAWLLDGTSWTQLSGVNADGFIGADIDADGADELVGDFGSTGLWLWNLTWTQLSGVNADGMIAADTDGDGVEEVVGDFGSTGLWLWKGGSWTQMSGVNADGVIAANVDPAAGREIIADFGTTGLWLLKTGAWSQISGVNAQGLAAGRVDADAEEEMAADFGGLGVWVYDAGAWSLVSGANPDQLVVANMTVDADDEIVADFATIGIYLWDSGAWVQINGVNPDFLIAANVDLDLEAEIAADFATLGVWLWNNGVWNQISSTNPENMIAKY